MRTAFFLSYSYMKADNGMYNEYKSSAADQPQAAGRVVSDPNFNPVPSKHEIEFLEGPSSRWKELMFLLRVFREFIYSFQKLHFIGPCVTFFGSARFSAAHPHYQLARTVGQEVAKMGFTVLTGGGPGIMEAANRGAKDVGGRSIGCNIILPMEQEPNPYLDRWINVRYFFVRKVLLTKYSYAFMVMPGGYGTLDEFFEALTLIQTRKFARFPVVIMGKAYHKELYEHLQLMVAEKTIDPEDLRLFLFTDSIEESIEHIRKYAVEGFGLKKQRKFRPIRWLGERRVFTN